MKFGVGSSQNVIVGVSCSDGDLDRVEGGLEGSELDRGELESGSECFKTGSPKKGKWSSTLCNKMLQVVISRSRV